MVVRLQVLVADKVRPAHAGRSPPHRVVGVDIGVGDLLSSQLPRASN